ncbi:MAG TPA: phosphate ABC transporter permease PstA [Roseiflexaceae bacterium]|nr:phosphate ABC transporter permease PstA [Roseiflexaceae bacterium]
MSLRASATPNYGRRKAGDWLMRGMTVLCTLVAIVPLVLIIGYVLVVGGKALNTEFFTQAYLPPLTIAGEVTAPTSDLGTSAGTPAAGLPSGDTAALEPATAQPTVAQGDTQAASTSGEPAPTADPFANIDVGALAGASPDNTAGMATPAPGAPTADPFANIDVGALAGAGAAPTPLVGATPADAGALQQPVAMPATDVVARGGVLHGIVGTLLVTGVALLLAIPIGLLAGIFLAEYPKNRLATIVRFCTDVLSGAPSIIAGVVAYILLVQRFQAFSGLAGSVALTILMVPTITRTTEEMLKLVPTDTREAAQALGAPTWYATFTVVVPTALAGIITGILLAFARGAGETAPLILTVLGNNELTYNLLGPIAALPLLTYRYTESPFPSENTLAWGTAFVLMMTVLLVNVFVRLATRSRLRGR